MISYRDGAGIIGGSGIGAGAKLGIGAYAGVGSDDEESNFSLSLEVTHCFNEAKSSTSILSELVEKTAAKSEHPA